MSWYNQIGNDFDTVVRSRVRLARNIAGYPFASKLSADKAKEIIEKVTGAFAGKDLEKIDISDISGTMALSYVEKHYVSKEFAQNRLPHALLLNENSGTSIMICEEDHLRIQSILPGLDLESAYKMASEYDDILDSTLDIAYDEELGYLTHCPTNLGTGMRASVMMFFSALTMAGRISALATELSKLGLTMRGMYGEGSRAGGMLYQISNQITLGISEEDAIEKLTGAVNRVVERERQLRETLVTSGGIDLEDSICRSLGLLRYAKKMSSKEFLKLWSDVKFGVESGVIKELDGINLSKLLVEAMPAHILKKYPETATSSVRDAKRAEIIKSYFV